MRLFVPFASLALIIVSVTAPRLSRGAAAVPAQRQAAILGRVLTYDRTMRERAGETVVVAVVYRAGISVSEACSNSMFDGFRGMERFVLHGLPFKAIRLPYDGNWRDALRTEGVDAVYVCDGLADDVEAIAAVARQRKITTMGAREEFVLDKLSVGVFNADDKPTIVLNYAVSLEEGAAFSPTSSG